MESKSSSVSIHHLGSLFMNLFTLKAQGQAGGGGGLEEKGGGWAEVLWAASKGSRVEAADWRHDLIAAVVMETARFCCRRPPPGPWSVPTLGQGWGSGL